MLTFILNVLAEVFGIGNLYCRPFYSAESRLCARPRDFQNLLLNVVLANFGRSLPTLIVEQTPTALLADGERDSAQQVIDFARAFDINGRVCLGGLHSAAWNT